MPDIVKNSQPFLERMLNTILIRTCLVFVMTSGIFVNAQTILNAGNTIDLPFKLGYDSGFPETCCLTINIQGNLAVMDGEIQIMEICKTKFNDYQSAPISPKLTLDYYNRLSLIAYNREVWSTGAVDMGEAGGFLRFEGKKELVLYDRSGKRIWGSIWSKQSPPKFSPSGLAPGRHDQVEIGFFYLKSNL